MAGGSVSKTEAVLGIHDVLLPLDGTAFGERALGTAVAFATAVDARLELVHVTGDAPTSADPSPKDGYLAELARTIQGVTVSTRVEPDLVVPAAEIPGTAGEFAVCMATHAHGGIPGAVLGGIADELLARTSAPFLLVGPEMDASAIPTFAGGHVVLCSDGSEHAESMASLASDVARTTGASIDVAMVLHRHGEFLGDRDATRPKERAQTLVDRFTEQGLNARLVLLDGLDPARAIAHHAAELPATLIVTPTHGSKGVVRTLMGSTAMRIVHHAPCPVLVRRPG